MCKTEEMSLALVYMKKVLTEVDHQVPFVLYNSPYIDRKDYVLQDVCSSISAAALPSSRVFFVENWNGTYTCISCWLRFSWKLIIYVALYCFRNDSGNIKMQRAVFQDPIRNIYD